MVSIGPYSQTSNFTHMFDQPDLRGDIEEYINPNSLMSKLYNNNEFSQFIRIVEIAKLNNILEDIYSTYTLFIPKNNTKLNENFFHSLDISTARQIVLSSTLNYLISPELIKQFPATQLTTKNKNYKLYITNINKKTKINNKINLLEQTIQCGNGIIHIIDNLILPNIIL